MLWLQLFIYDKLYWFILRAINYRSLNNLYTNMVLDGSVILFVRYRNHFTVVQFQNQAHIWNPHGTGQVFKTIWGAIGAPIFFFIAAPCGAPLAPQILFIFIVSPPPKAAVAQRWRRRRRSSGGEGKSRARRVFRKFF